jgi:fumarate reductase subunit C
VRPPENPHHTPFHPRWHRRRTPITWWRRKGVYLRFILRELTSLAVGYAALLLLAQLWFVDRGPEAHAAFRAWLAHPAVLVFHAGVLAAVLFHAVTWIHLAPTALRLRVGRWEPPPFLVLVLHYVAWVSVSAMVVVMLRGTG